MKQTRKRSRRSRKRHQKGGSRGGSRGGGVVSSPSAGPVGQPWVGHDESSWGQGNHYPYHAGNLEALPVISQAEQSGGRRRRRRKTKRTRTRKSKRTRSGSRTRTRTRTRSTGRRRRHVQRGGGRSTLIPQPLVNLARNVEFGMQSGMNLHQGKPPPMSPSPIVQPIARGTNYLGNL